MGPLKKITSKNNDIFLFIDIPDERRNNMGIASGESVLLSIHDSDSFYFTKNINLIRYEDIQLSVDASPSEVEFFELVKSAGEKKYKKSLVNEYHITNYVRYLPRITFTQKIENNIIKITGMLKNANPDSIHPFEVPTILHDNVELPLNENLQFEYMLPENFMLDKVEFQLDFPKQVLTRSYKLK